MCVLVAECDLGSVLVKGKRLNRAGPIILASDRIMETSEDMVYEERQRALERMKRARSKSRRDRKPEYYEDDDAIDDKGIM